MESQKSNSFENHEIKIMSDTEEVFCARFASPEDEYNLAITITCIPSANQITIGGDLRHLTINPGYGRGISWLYSSHTNQHYLSGKIEEYVRAGFRNFDSDKAVEDIKNHIIEDEKPSRVLNKFNEEEYYRKEFCCQTKALEFYSSIDEDFEYEDGEFIGTKSNMDIYFEALEEFFRNKTMVEYFGKESYEKTN